MTKIGTRSPVRTEDILAFLSNPEHYPGTVEKVVVLETHLSYVFITDGFVYKMKKPVNFSFLDLSNLEQRKKNSEEEIEVNRRLAPEIYTGIVPVRRDESGQLNLDKKGVVVEWLVRMRRLPDNLMMGYKIAENSVKEEDLIKVGKKLSGFYTRQHPVQMEEAFYIQRLKKFLCANLNDLKDPLYEINGIRLNRLLYRQLRFLSEYAPSFEERVGKIVDAHGDLRPEHICLTKDPVIIDGLEFSKKLRILDPFEELAYFSLECAMLDAGWIGDEVIRIYKNETGDEVDDRIISFYKSIRAILRALNSFRHIRETRYCHEMKWKIKGEQYLKLAEKYIGK